MHPAPSGHRSIYLAEVVPERCCPAHVQISYGDCGCGRGPYHVQYHHATARVVAKPAPHARLLPQMTHVISAQSVETLHLRSHSLEAVLLHKMQPQVSAVPRLLALLNGYLHWRDAGLGKGTVWLGCCCMYSVPYEAVRQKLGRAPRPLTQLQPVPAP